MERPAVPLHVTYLKWVVNLPKYNTHKKKNISHRLQSVARQLILVCGNLSQRGLLDQTKPAYTTHVGRLPEPLTD